MSRVPIPKDALDDRLGIFGTAGSGKTYTALLFAEIILSRGERIGHIDPLGVSWGLRLSADGKSPSSHKIVIFGGKHGDLPINDRAGALIGEAVTTMAESWIIDLSELGTKAAERRFMLPFLETLYRKHNGAPLHVIFDEADMWAPERLLDKEGEAAKLLGMMETLVRRGRVKGFIPWLISQRPAVLSKNVLSQVDGLIAMKLTSSQDRKALGAWIEGQADQEQGKAILGALPTKQRGEAVIWIPGRDILKEATFPERETFDSSRTPKRGEKVKKTVPLAPLDLERLKEKLSSVEAESKANDPKALRTMLLAKDREITELKKNRGAAVDISALNDAEQKGFRRGWAEGIENYKQSIFNPLTESVSLLKTVVSLKTPDCGVFKPTKPAAKVAPIFRKDTFVPKTNGEDHSFTGPQRKIISSLGFWLSIGHETPSREQVAIVAGYSANGSAFTNPLSGLKTSGAIDYPVSGHVRLAQGIQTEVPDRGQARETLLSVLSGPQRKILSAAKEGEASREIIAERSGYSADGSAFTNPLSGLRTLGLINYPQTGYVALSDWAAELLA